MKDIKGYEGLYAITEEGQVWSYRSKKFLSATTTGNGYLGVYLHKNGGRKCCLVHRLVATHFIPNPDNLPQVNHKDEQKDNNHVSNLEWCTPQYNTNYGTKLERTGAHKSKAVYCEETDTIYASGKEAAEALGLCKSGISMCCSGKQKAVKGYHFKFVSP